MEDVYSAECRKLGMAVSLGSDASFASSPCARGVPGRLFARSGGRMGRRLMED